MIRFVLFALFISTLISSGCTSTSSHNDAPELTTVDIDEIDGNFVAQEFAGICLSENQSVKQLKEFAQSQGWSRATEKDLKRSRLQGLRRKILEIPGGGGRYRETQILLNFRSAKLDLIANMMERFDRQERLVRTECTLYASKDNHLPICAAIGILLARPPDSNQKFPSSNSQFIRWNTEINKKATSIRCDGMGLVSKPNQGQPIRKNFVGTVIATIVDHHAKNKPRYITSSVISQPQEK